MVGTEVSDVVALGTVVEVVEEEIVEWSRAQNP